MNFDYKFFLPGNLSINNFKQEIKKRYRSFFFEEEILLIDQALKIAEPELCDKHSLFGVNLWRHTLEYVFLLTNLEVDLETLLAGILHHLPADSYNYKKIQNLFGPKVAALIKSIGESTSFLDNNVTSATHICDLLDKHHQDLRETILKLVHRLQNLIRSQKLPLDQQKKLARQTLELHLPIANRLGIYRLQQAFEEKCLQILHPKIYKKLDGAIRHHDQEDKATLRLVIRAVKKELKKNKIQATVEARRKSIFSIYTKMLRKKRRLHELFDILGVRIITADIPECYKTLAVIYTKFEAIPDKFKDYIGAPKANNYQSLHTVIYPLKGVSYKPIEIQIRTKEMHENAQYGSAAHWRYAEGRYFLYSRNDQLKWLKHVLNFHKKTKDYQDFVSELKKSLKGKSRFEKLSLTKSSQTVAEYSKERKKQGIKPARNLLVPPYAEPPIKSNASKSK